MSTTTSKDDIVALAEGAEAELYYRYETSAEPAIAATLGIACTRIGGGVVLSMRHDVTGYWSKALGFGFAEPVTAGLIEEVVAHFQRENSPGATIQIAPAVLPADWDDICSRHGLRRGSLWIKLGCSTDEFQPHTGTALRVGPVRPEDLTEWATTAMRGFGMPPESLAPMMAAGATHPGFHPFAAWDGEQMVAAANLLIHGEAGSLNSASTLPTHRHRGAQSALIAARAAAAIDAGCRWLIAETGKPGEGEVNSSLDNLVRSGLAPLYERQDWLWRPAD
jgi:hypothetical protein